MRTISAIVVCFASIICRMTCTTIKIHEYTLLSVGGCMRFIYVGLRITEFSMSAELGVTNIDLVSIHSAVINLSSPTCIEIATMVATRSFTKCIVYMPVDCPVSTSSKVPPSLFHANTLPSTCLI
ncbi:hypothetical protein BC629DRAFT_267013 [Irpex lacteus]|nr:hypothetical protein BC629DRAFT_267013 [Irpex lacteus]